MLFNKIFPLEQFEVYWWVEDSDWTSSGDEDDDATFQLIIRKHLQRRMIFLEEFSTEEALEIWAVVQFLAMDIWDCIINACSCGEHGQSIFS
jgi:hypothetical protein